MDLDIGGNVALVTASTSGLGKASALAFVREGANVVVNGRDKERLDEAVEDVSAEGTGEVIGVQADLTDADDITRLIDRTVQKFGGIDHLATSTGGPPSGPFLEIDDSDWYDAYDLLVMSVVRTIREAVPHLREDGGTIVTITSRSVKEAIESLVLSNSVRMSVIGLEKTLSKELGPEIRANAVLPGPHETARIRNLVEAGVERGEYESYEAGLAARGQANPLGRIGNPRELGDTVVYLSSPRAGYINGESLLIDGGQSSSNL